MRRLFVICLILLLPLNMFALAMAASAMQPAAATEHVTPTPHLAQLPADAFGDAPAAVFADAYLPGAYDCQTGCDIDPDEPPAGADIHDSVNEDMGPALAFGATRTIPPATLARPSHATIPPLKPPRAA